jgi:NADPH-dependent 2,4-dienoyl-CoA reductase/sulfur reductase-like enzyme
MLNRSLARSFSTAVSHSRVAIVGGGTGGLSLSAQLINSKKFAARDITVFEPAHEHHYQPGYTNVGGGAWKSDWKSGKLDSRLSRSMDSLFNPNINMVKKNVSRFDPEENALFTSDGDKHTYDSLVVASGVELRYDQIPGSIEALDDPECPAGSIYRIDYTHKMSELREGFKGGKAVFTLPLMPIKCGGAPQKILYLSETTWRKNGVRGDCDIHFYTSVPNLFPNCKKFADALEPIAQDRGINVHYKHLIKSVDGANRRATFEVLDSGEHIEVDFDLLHITPPQSAHKFIRESPLAAANGFLDVNIHNMQHNKYPNIWGLGDVCNLPTAKTAAAIFSQTPIVVDALIKKELGKTTSGRYNGYSSCPLYTGNDKLMLIEFKYEGVADETFLSTQNKPNRAFFHFKRDIFPWVYWNIMPRGRWFGRRMIFPPKYA